MRMPQSRYAPTLSPSALFALRIACGLTTDHRYMPRRNGERTGQTGALSRWDSVRERGPAIASSRAIHSDTLLFPPKWTPAHASLISALCVPDKPHTTAGRVRVSLRIRVPPRSSVAAPRPLPRPHCSFLDLDSGAKVVASTFFRFALAAAHIRSRNDHAGPVWPPSHVSTPSGPRPHPAHAAEHESIRTLNRNSTVNIDVGILPYTPACPAQAMCTPLKRSH